DVSDGWRVAGRHERSFEFRDQDGAPFTIRLLRDEGAWTYVRNEATQTLEWIGESTDPSRAQLRLRLDGRDHTGEVLRRGEVLTIYLGGEAHVLRLHDAVAHAQDEAGDHGG